MGWWQLPMTVAWACAGEYDPWRIGGILEDISESVVSLFIEQGAHHVDLMFSHAADPPSVTAARRCEEAHIRRWIFEHAARQGSPAHLGVTSQ